MPNLRLARVVVAGTAISIMSLSGCGRSDAEEQAIESAAEKLTFVMSGPNVSPIAERKETGLKEVLQIVQPLVSSDDASISVAANTLAARAQSGLGEIAATEAAEHERLASNSLATIVTLADVWSVQNARAREAAAYDPAAELDALTKSEREIERLIGEATAERQKAEARVSGFEKEADAVLAQAKAKRDEAAQLKQRMSGTDATGALALLEQATAIAREADALDLRASGIRGQAFAAAPAVDAARREIELLISRRESVAKLKRLVGERASTMRTAAEESRAAADAAGTALSAAISEVADRRRGALASALESAARHFRDASASARKAGQGATGPGKTSANLLAASAQQSLGDVQLLQARGDSTFAGVLAAIVEAAPNIPGKAGIEGMITEFGERATRARTESQEAYRAARDGFQGAGAGADLSERIEKITRILTNLTGETPAAPTEPVNPAAAATDETAATPASAPPADDAQAAERIRAMLTELAGALNRGDALTASGFFAASTPAQEQAMDTLITPGLNLAALDGALREKFSATLAQILAASPMGAMLGPSLKDFSSFDLKPAELQIEVMGDKAIVSKNGLPAHALVRMGERWLVDVPADAAAAMGPMGAIVKGLGDAAAELVPGVKDGTYKTKEEFLSAFMAKLGPMMQKLGPMPGMPTMPGKPGGGG
ncbi:MAG: hypothetical protein AB7K52_00310 [Phycisphaerales bacterium]